MSIVSKYEFERKYPILDEACRQWYAFIQEDPSRADGEGFGQFYEELSRRDGDGMNGKAKLLAGLLISGGIAALCCLRIKRRKPCGGNP